MFIMMKKSDLITCLVEGKVFISYHVQGELFLGCHVEGEGFFFYRLSC